MGELEKYSKTLWELHELANSNFLFHKEEIWIPLKKVEEMWGEFPKSLNIILDMFDEANRQKKIDVAIKQVEVQFQQYEKWKNKWSRKT